MREFRCVYGNFSFPHENCQKIKQLTSHVMSYENMCVYIYHEFNSLNCIGVRLGSHIASENCRYLYRNWIRFMRNIPCNWSFCEDISEHDASPVIIYLYRMCCYIYKPFFTTLFSSFCKMLFKFNCFFAT